MEKIFETLKVTSAPTTSVFTPSKTSTPMTTKFQQQNHTTTTNNQHHYNSGDAVVRRSPNNFTKNNKRSNNGRVDYNNKSLSPSANHQRLPSQKQEHSSPIDILFKTNLQNQKTTPNSTNNTSRGVGRRSPPNNNYHSNRGRENYTPPNVSPPTGQNYAGPKFSESPSPRALPLPPLHWLQANRDFLMIMGNHQSPPALKMQT